MTSLEQQTQPDIFGNTSPHSDTSSSTLSHNDHDLTCPWPHFYCLVNYREMKISHVKGELEQMMGYSKEMAENNTSEFAISFLHPDDRGKVLELTAYFHAFVAQQPTETRKNYKASMDFRVKRADGKYIRLMEQTGILEVNEAGHIMLVVKFYTEITHLKKENKVQLTLLHNEQIVEDAITVDAPEEIKKSEDTLSKREKQILQLIAKGNSARAIADTLFISEHTVKNHRKNILKKLKLKNSHQLITYSLQYRPG